MLLKMEMTKKGVTNIPYLMGISSYPFRTTIPSQAELVRTLFLSSPRHDRGVDVVPPVLTFSPWILSFVCEHAKPCLLCFTITPRNFQIIDKINKILKMAVQNDKILNSADKIQSRSERLKLVVFCVKFFLSMYLFCWNDFSFLLGGMMCRIFP